MKYFAVSLLALTAGGLASYCAARGPQNPTPPPEGSVIRSEVTRVNMLFTVTDKKGRFVTDLKQDDFQVFENKKPQNILEFTAETDLPLRLAILIDTSNSIRDRFHFQQEAATNFINSVVRRAGQGHRRQLRHGGGTGGRSDQRYRTSSKTPCAICGPAAAPRSTTPSILPARTS